MTLIIARRREDFAILASDGLWSKEPHDDIPKIACHSSLAIGCTVSGLLALPLPADDPFRKEHSIPLDLSARATMYISAVLDEITSNSGLTTEDIGARLAAKLVPFVNETNYIACHVPMVKNEKAEVGFMMVGMRAQWPPNPADYGGWGWWPDGVRQWCGPPEVADLFDREIAQAETSPPQTSDELACVIRKMVSDAIAEESRRTGGRRSIGGAAHVAKVTRDGVTFF